MKYRNAAHYLAGILTAISTTVSWALPLIGFAGFLAYELNEDWHLSDKAYHDILEYLMGFFVATGGLVIWNFL